MTDATDRLEARADAGSSEPESGDRSTESLILFGGDEGLICVDETCVTAETRE